jgi:hypothetical protein
MNIKINMKKLMTKHFHKIALNLDVASMSGV